MSGGGQGPKGPRAALWRGLADPDLLIVACALLLAGFCLVGLQWMFTSGRFTVVPEARFLRAPRDDWGHVSWQIGSLKRHPPKKTAVYLLGGSNVRECIQTEASLQQAIAERSGIDTEVHDLASTNQHFGESMAIVENAPLTPGLMVIGVNQTRFSYDPASIRLQLQGRELLLRSPALRQFTMSQGSGGRFQLTILPGIANYVSGWVQKHEKTLAKGRLTVTPYLKNRYTETQVWSAKRKRSRVDLWLGNRGAPGGDFDKYFEYDAALLEAMVKLATERGFVPVLMEVPQNEEIIRGDFDQYKQVYQPFCEQLAQKYGGYYIDVGEDTGLVNADFRDLTHLVEPGRAKWTSALAAALAPIVPRTNDGEVAP